MHVLVLSTVGHLEVKKLHSQNFLRIFSEFSQNFLQAISLPLRESRKTNVLNRSPRPGGTITIDGVVTFDVAEDDEREREHE